MRREKIKKVSFSLKQTLRALRVCSQHPELGTASGAERSGGEEDRDENTQAVSYPVFAAGVFEGAEDERAAAVVLDVVGQVLPGDVGRAALVRTLDGEARAVVLVVLQRIVEHRMELMSGKKKEVRRRFSPRP